MPGIIQQQVYHIKVQNVSELKQRVIDVRAGVVHTALLTMTLTSRVDVSMPVSESAEDI